MTYAANALLPSVESNIFIRANPSILGTTANGFSWSVYSGNIWVADFTLGYVVSVFLGDVEQTLESDAASVGSGEYFYDAVLKKLYVYSVGSPGSSNFVITYELYWATDHLKFPRSPDSTADAQNNPIVEWKPVITKSPQTVDGQIDFLFGFIPINGSSFDVEMVSGDLYGTFVRSIFFKSKIEVWHCLGEFKLDNFKSSFYGTVGNPTFDDVSASIPLDSIQYVLDQTYLGKKYFSKSDFPNLDPAAEIGVWPIRKVYGRVIGFIPVNVDYSDAPTTTNNRQWVVSQEQANASTYDVTQDHLAANSPTETFVLAGNNYIDVDDWVQVEGPTTTVKVLTKTSTKITHASVGARAVVAGMTVHRSFISKITIIDENNASWNILYGDHWTETNFANDTKGFTLINNFEATIAGFPSPFNPALHQIYVNVYGENDLPQYRILAGDIGSLPDAGGMISHPISILSDLIFPIFRGALTTRVDEQSLADAITDINGSFSTTVRTAMAIPRAHTDKFPTYNDLVSQLCQSSFLRIHSGNMNGVSGIGFSHFKSVQAIAADYELDETEIFNVSIEVEASDIYTDYDVDFNIMKEIHEPVSSVYQFFRRIGSTDASIKTLYGTVRTLSQESLFIDPTNTQDYLSLIRGVLGVQRIRYTFNVQYRLWEAKIGEVVSITRGQILGVDYIDGEVNTIKGSIVELSRSVNGVGVTIEIY